MPNSEGNKRSIERDKTTQKRKRKPEYTRVNAAGVESIIGSDSTQEEKQIDTQSIERAQEIRRQMRERRGFSHR